MFIFAMCLINTNKIMKNSIEFVNRLLKPTILVKENIFVDSHYSFKDFKKNLHSK